MMKKTLLTFLVLMCAMVSAFAADPVYTLTCPVSTSNTAYASNYNVTIDGIKWSLPGNQSFSDGVRVGGKGITAVNRFYYSQTAISANVKTISVSYGAHSASSSTGAALITVNSVKLDVYSTAELAKAGAAGDVCTVTGTYAANSTKVFTCPSGKDWTGRFYRITWNVTNSKTTNYYITVKNVKFYDVDLDNVKVPTLSHEAGCYDNPINLSIASETGTTIKYSTDNKTWSDYTAPISLSEKTTIYAKAVKGTAESDVVSATYSFTKRYASIDDLAKVTPSASSKDSIIVTLNKVALDSVFVTAKGERRGVYVTGNGKKIEIYCATGGVPESWEAEGTISGEVKGVYTIFNKVWEVVIHDASKWSALTYEAPKAKRPTITTPSGHYDDAISVVITPNDDSSIKYSTDGVNYSAYTSPVTISENTTVYAKAVSGDAESAVVSAEYTFTPRYASLDALGKVTPEANTKDSIIVYFKNVEIDSLYITSKGNHNGIYVTANGNPVRVFCYDVPTSWEKKGTVTGWVKGVWYLYNKKVWTLSLASDASSWNQLSYKAPVPEGCMEVDPSVTTDYDNVPEGYIAGVNRPENGMVTFPEDDTQNQSQNGAATGIDNAESANAKIVSIVTANGSVASELQKGLNIVTLSNGKRVKIMK